jgi:hypothetical protein
MVGTFNVCDYPRKQCVAVQNDEVDLDLLVAGVSLPVFSPAVRRDARIYLDAVWIKDTNVDEAVRRGADELWLVWAIGNHGVYRNGIFQQYVHMIEMTANGALLAQLRAVRALNEARQNRIRLHVIHPRVPLPLDPDFFLGRVDAATLVSMGHRDACEYLERADSEGVPLGADATRMQDPRPGVGFRETLQGDVGGPARVRLGWEVDDLEEFARDGTGTIVGDVSHPVLGERVLATGGAFLRDGRRCQAELRLPTARLDLVREQRSWSSVRARLLNDAGEELGAGRLRATGTPAWATVHARGVGSTSEGARAVARFARIVLTSAGVLGEPSQRLRGTSATP